MAVTRKIRIKRLLAALSALLLIPFGALPPFAEGETNLARGKSVSVQSDAANGRSYGELDRFEPQKLTDGAYGRADFGDTAWNKFYRAVGRTLTVDLGENCRIDRVCARFLHNCQAGVTSPRKIKVYVSQNGVDFAEAKVLSGGEPPFAANYGTKTEIALYDLTVEPAAARYVALHFDVVVNTFIDEIEIYGGRTGVPEPLTEFTDIVKDENAFFPREGLGGDHDIVLFHAGYYPQDEKLVNNTEEQFLAYIGYRDAKGKIADTMFDSVMFLTLQGNSPSGGNLTISGEKTVMSDWVTLLDSYFSAEYNLGALDRAAAKLKQTLSLGSEHKISVYLTCPYPKTGTPVFGDIDGDGAEEGINGYSDCLAVTAWFIDSCLARWEEAGYENLAFKGFFCNSEGLTGSRYEYEERYASDAAALMHERGLLCVMIPYLHGEGIDRYKELGLDAALMQPNLSFNDTLKDDPEGVMLDFAQTAKRFGLGIEMEIADGARWEPETLGKYYEQYLVSGAQSGLMTGTVHAYYNGAGPGVFYDCAVSAKPELRRYYDLTYKFIKGTLEYPENYGVHDTQTEYKAAERERITGDTGVSGDWGFTYKISENPQHGYVVFDAADNSFSYTPDRKFAGADSFGYTVVCGGEEVLARRITVEVAGGEAPAEESSAPEQVSQPENGITGADRSGTRIAVYAVCGALALAAGAVCVYFALRALKKRKKGGENGEK
ncbi:MAG: DUF4855 domain-containing protein [Clostridia bacterium]|nr:DUF4855 domain-containing protein [Clostridia bacterium]